MGSPESTISKADLEMVCGADELLNKLHKKETDVTYEILETSVENFNLLEFA